MKPTEPKDKEFIDAIRAGQPEGWAQFIEHYQGRLLNYARSRLPQQADAEDVVQNTFVSFVKAIDQFRGESKIEHYLFAILRNQIYNLYRVKSVKTVCLLQDVYHDDPQSDAFGQLAMSCATPSEYIWREDQKQILADAIRKQLRRFKKVMKFDNLKLVDLLFYVGISNKSAATLLQMEPKTVGVFKHRFIKRLCDDISNVCSQTEPFVLRFEGMLTEVWESHRLSCPKRSTLGAFLLENLDAAWFDYVDFHITTLGCYFCRANLKDLINEKNSDRDQVFRERIVASTIGFLAK